MLSGTNHFVNRQAAYIYYKAYGCNKQDVDIMFNKGIICLGKPAIRADESIMYHRGEGRYYVETCIL